jgi:hypothetical protein
MPGVFLYWYQIINEVFMKRILFLALILLTVLNAQIRIVSIEKLKIPNTQHWSNALFSPDGKEIFLTNSEFDGIWQFSLSTKLLKEITQDKNSGYNFAISDDGQKIAYRRTVVEGDQRSRVQENVEIDLKTSKETIGERGNSISTPVFIYDQNSKDQTILIGKSNSISAGSTAQIVGIENSKIALLKNGVKSIVDPIKNGQYIWPVLSPDKSKFVAIEMERGAFISDLDGKNIVFLGKCNSPQWTLDGKWIIGMDDRDDGRSIYSSEVIAVSTDGTKRIQLTNTSSIIEMFPSVSRSENKIVTSTSEGEVFVLTFEEGQ